MNVVLAADILTSILLAKVGCDHVLNSEKQIDVCGVCSGNNSCIRSTPVSPDGDKISNDREEVTYNEHELSIEHDHQREQELNQRQKLAADRENEKGNANDDNNDKKKKKRKKHNSIDFYDWEVIYNVCSVTCSLGVRQPRLVCRDIRVNAIVADELCLSVPKIEPPDPKPCYMQKCPPRWEAKEWQTCTVTCGGGARLREVRCMEYGPTGHGRWVNDRFCNQYKPSEYKSCNSDICPRWYAGEWSPCSVTCGFGIQYRIVICRNSNNKTCHENEKPRVSQACTTNLPCFERSGDIQETVLTDFKESSPPKYGMVPNISKSELSAPRFIPYDLSPCSVTCGTGVKTRRVPCKIFLQFLNEVTEVPEKECIDAGQVKPHSTIECIAGMCVAHGSGAINAGNGSEYRLYVWKLSGFTFGSDNNVKEAKQSLRLCCYDAGLRSEVNQSHCTSQPVFYLYNKWCSIESHCFGWYYLDEYTPCHPTCGNSTQQRLVECVEESTQQIDGRLFSAVQGKFCLSPMPKMHKSCVSTAKCKASWGLGPWEKCSVSCSGGLQKRWLRCQKVLPNGNLVNVSDADCADTPRHRAIRVCNSFPCQKPRMKEPVLKFFQLTHSTVVNVFTGSHVFVLPGTIVSIRCLVRGIDRSTIVWLRDGKPLGPSEPHVKYSQNSFQRIKVRTLFALKKTENYTCRSDTFYKNVSRTLESTAVLHFISLGDILRETAYRETYLLGTTSTPHANTTDPYDKNPRRVYFVAGSWSRCTAGSCKRYGRQARNVSCEIITTNYFEELPSSVCKKAKLKRPTRRRKCRLDCFKWITYDWSKCLPRKCIRDNVSIQKRQIICYNSMTHTITRRRNCEHLTMPPLQRECTNALCRSYWKTAATWKKCRGKCGKHGLQTRALWCLWERTGLSAKDNCYSKPRPLIKRPCILPPCKLGGTNQ